jgi:hypothetical protein
MAKVPVTGTDRFASTELDSISTERPAIAADDEYVARLEEELKKRK